MHAGDCLVVGVQYWRFQKLGDKSNIWSDYLHLLLYAVHRLLVVRLEQLTAGLLTGLESSVDGEYVRLDLLLRVDVDLYRPYYCLWLLRNSSIQREEKR